MALLDVLKKRYETDSKSSQITKWREDAIIALDFYDGKQLDAKTLQELNERNQPPIVINMIAPRVDSVINSELQTKTKIIYKSRTLDPEFNEIADGLTTLALNVQENADTQYEMSAVFEDELKVGIGWLEVYVKDGIVMTERADPFSVIWDTQDTTKNLSNLGHVSIEKWYSREEAKARFPKHSKYLNDLINDYNNNREKSDYFDEEFKKIKIIEQQYKKRAKKYRFIDLNGKQKEVFSEEHAKKYADKEFEIEEIDCFEVWTAFFTEDKVLENLPNSVQTGEFTLVPSVYKRDRNLSPYGIIKNSIDPQREVNKRRSKMMHLLNTNMVIADNNAVDDLNTLAKEVSRPDGVIIKKPGSLLEIKNNVNLAESQFRVMSQAGNDISNTMGVFDESIGQPTNATSGVAIQRRKQATLSTKGGAFNSFNLFKKRFGRVFGVLLQNMFSDTPNLQIYKDDGSIITLNKPTERNGKKVFERDLSTLFFGVHVSEQEDYESDVEALADRMRDLALNGQTAVLKSPTYTRLLGVKPADAERLLQELQNEGNPSPENAQDGNAVETMR